MSVAGDPPPRDGDEELAGARLQRIDAPEPTRTLALTLRGGGVRRCLLLVADVDERGGGLRLVDDRPRGEVASAFVRRLRKELENGRLVAVEELGGTWRVRLRRGELERRLVLDRRAGGGVLLYLDAEDRVLGAPAGGMLRAVGLRPGARWTPPPGEPIAHGAATLRGRATRASEDEGRARRTARVTALRAALRRSRKRLERKAAAIAGDARRADDAPSLRARADALTRSLASENLAEGTAEVWDWTLTPPVRNTLTLEPGLDARAQAARWFALAKRFERGAEIARARGRDTDEALAAITALEAELGAVGAEGARAREEDETDAALARLEERAAGLGAHVPSGKERLGTRSRPGGTRRAGGTARLPYRVFLGSADREIRVGRTAKDNDALTLRHARPFDLWLHVRGDRGSHVVVPLRRDESCPPELLVDAAMLAAHFSNARRETQVEVTYALRKHVRKPRGFPPGAVRVDREKSLLLRVEPERIRVLLGRETITAP